MCEPIISKIAPPVVVTTAIVCIVFGIPILADGNPIGLVPLIVACGWLWIAMEMMGEKSDV